MQITLSSSSVQRAFRFIGFRSNGNFVCTTVQFRNFSDSAKCHFKFTVRLNCFHCQVTWIIIITINTISSCAIAARRSIWASATGGLRKTRTSTWMQPKRHRHSAVCGLCILYYHSFTFIKEKWNSAEGLYHVCVPKLRCRSYRHRVCFPISPRRSAIHAHTKALCRRWHSWCYERRTHAAPVEVRGKKGESTCGNSVGGFFK